MNEYITLSLILFTIGSVGVLVRRNAIVVFMCIELMLNATNLAFEFTSALLITAALGAMVLAHKERLTTRHTQAEIAARRMREYAESGRHPGPLPAPGVFARHNAVDTPALLPDGTPLESSISESLVARGQVREGFEDDIDKLVEQLGDEQPSDESFGGEK